MQSNATGQIFARLTQQPAVVYIKKMAKEMKMITTILSAACLLLSATALSQTVTLSVKNAQLEEVLHAIKKQTGYGHSLNNTVVKKGRLITLSVKNMPLEEVLKQCFRDQPFTYSIINKTIVIIPKETAAEMPIRSVTKTPPGDVSGKITNESGQPVSGATITIQGTGRITQTNDNGEFSLKDVPDDTMLSVTRVGYYPTQLKPEKNALVKIQLKLRQIIEEEIRVESFATGYEAISKDRATGSFYKVSNELVNRSVASSIISRLEHITSGLQLYQNQLSVRGRSTLFANQDPLIVVDNFPYDGRIENLNPNDIESITVLKDAAAASIWGALSGNGVIVITTKSGKYRQRLKVNALATITSGNKPDLFYNPAFLKSSDFIDVENFLFDRGYYNSALSNTTSFPAVSPVVEILAKKRAGSLSADEALAQMNLLRGLDVRNDLSKYLYHRSTTRQYAVNMSGGSDNASYYFSAGYDNNDAFNVGNDNNRFNLNLANNFTPTKGLEISGAINFVQTQSNTSNNTIGAAAKSTLYPYAQLADAAGDPLPIIQQLNTAYVESAESKGLLNWQYFPLNDINLTTNTTKGYDTRINAGIKYTVIKGLSIESRYQYLKSISNNDVLQDENSFSVRNQVNRFSVINPNGTVKRNLPSGGIYNTTNTDLSSHSGRAQIGYNNNSRKHTISAIAGIEIRQVETNRNKNGFYGYDQNTGTYSIINYDSLYRTLPNGTARIPLNAGIGGTLNRFRSYYGNLSYTYNKRYTISASSRIDQSNFFGYKANQRSIPLWSAGAKWDVGKENFYTYSQFPQLALRATYGYNGNLDKSASPLTLAQYSTGDDYTGALYGTILRPGNPELTWERIGMFNLGIDFGMKENVISGSIEYYVKNGRNLIGDAPIDPTVGFSSVTGNFSNMRAQGVDIVLNTINVNRKIKWESNLLFSYATNKVTKYTGANASNTILEGRPVNSLFVQQWGGLDPLTGDPMGYLADTVTKNYTALNALKLKDKIFKGSFVPVIFGALLNTVSYKNIALSINISYKFGYYFKRPSINYTNLFGTWIGHSDYSLRWQQKGDEMHTNVPSMIYPANSSRDQFYNNSLVLVEKGDNVRIEDIRVSYDITKKTWKRLPVSSVQLFVMVNNVGVIWTANKHGIDPNYVNAGYLPPAGFSFGLRTAL